MKKLVLSMAIVALMCSCGNSEANKDAETPKMEEPAIEASVKEDSVAKDGVVNELSDTAQLKSNKPVILDFNAEWCGPCKKFAPHFHSVAEKFADKATFLSVNVDNWKEVAAKYDAQSIPMVVIIKPDGKRVSKVGYMEAAEFEQFVSENI